MQSIGSSSDLSPHNLSQLTPAFVTETLRRHGLILTASVVAIEQRPLDCIAGYLSRMYQLSLTYDIKETLAPQSLVAKLVTDDPALRTLGDEQKVFEREGRFYNEIASASNMPVPKCFYSWSNEVGEGILIFEDLSELKGGDQVLGISKKEVMQTIDSISKLHSFWWNKTNSEHLKWIPDNAYIRAADYGEYWPAFEARFGERLKPDSLRLGRWVAEHMDKILNVASKRPHTIVHCDLRAENLRFDARKERVVVLDFQMACRGIGAHDIARLSCGSPTADFSAEQHESVCEYWHERLLENGVEHYSLLDAVSDYRLGFLLNLSNPVICASLIDTDGTRGQELLNVMVERYFHAASVMNDPAVLPGLIA